MRIHKQFIGGNIIVKEQQGKDIYLENEIRDTGEDWFYWAFCVEGAQGQELTFHFDKTRVGYYGPAVSHDLKNWHWLGKRDGESFTYRFGVTEDKVYFAHNMLYHPEQFYQFTDEKGLKIEELCKSRKGRSVPCVTFGEGEKQVILTARHHACEASGSYVLEGVLSELLDSPIPDMKVFCVPFVDFDGVVDGDQGKARKPYDHNRDYGEGTAPIYPETTAIRAFADQNGCVYGFDFHSPWHLSGVNDTVFIVQNSVEEAEKYNRFGRILMESLSKEALQYDSKNDYPYMTGWNVTTTNCSAYMKRCPDNKIAFSLETAYFGTEDNIVSQEKMVELGRCFVKALKKFIDME